MIFIGLGANLPSRHGTPPETIGAAITALEKNGLEILAQSRIWLTAPVPVSDQPWYHNAVVAIATSLPPLEVLKILQSIENDFGRVREIRNEPRVIDLDLLTYDSEILDHPDLVIPHPRMHERGFVLLPLQDISPEWTHPVSGKDLHMLITKLPAEQMAKPYEAAS